MTLASSCDRLVDGRFEPVATPTDVADLADDVVRSHLDSAQTLLAREPSPDMRHGIKASISAVETDAAVSEPVALSVALRAVRGTTRCHGLVLLIAVLGLSGCGGGKSAMAPDAGTTGDVAGALDAAPDAAPDAPPPGDADDAAGEAGAAPDASDVAADSTLLPDVGAGDAADTGKACPGLNSPAPEYDDQCAGNVGCKDMPCQVCATYCARCDGPHCVGVVVDDSCLSGPPSLSAWPGEPEVGLALASTEATLTASVPFGGEITLTLTQPPPLPVEAKWQKPLGNLQSQVLVAPVVVKADRVLAWGEWSSQNWCTGQVVGGSAGPFLLDITAQGNLPSAVWTPSGGGSWQVRLAWLRVYEDATGQRFVQWLQVPGQAAKPQIAQVSHAFPLAEATPVQVPSGPFDWANELGK